MHNPSVIRMPPIKIDIQQEIPHKISMISTLLLGNQLLKLGIKLQYKVPSKEYRADMVDV